MKTAIGGDRLGSGNKMVVDNKTFNRSNHDLSYLWRSSMSVGTLVPFMSLPVLPGDSFDIDLNAMALSLPTLGPLFGSKELQMDMFFCPIRLYNAKLYMNQQGLGRRMERVKFPLLRTRAQRPIEGERLKDESQINPSCLLSYLGMRGLGQPADQEPEDLVRYFNAIPFLGYWDIYKQYYVNKIS